MRSALRRQLDGVQQVLHALEKLADVPAVHGGVGDAQGEGQGQLPVVLRELAIGQDGEEMGLPAGDQWRSR